MSAPAHRPPPVTPELWERLRRLDPQCSIIMQRDRPNLSVWSRRAKRTWRVLIRHLDAKVFDYADAEHPTLAEAMRAAIEQAEERGWAR